MRKEAHPWCDFRACSVSYSSYFRAPTLVKRTRAERHARGFTCWGQFVAMLFCQLGRAHSLREICGGLRSAEGKLSHLGITAPSRFTLAYANEHRPNHAHTRRPARWPSAIALASRRGANASPTTSTSPMPADRSASGSAEFTVCGPTQITAHASAMRSSLPA